MLENAPTRRHLLQLGLGLAAYASLGTALAAERPIVLVFMSDTSKRTLAIVDAFKSKLDFATKLTYDLSQEQDAGAFIADQIRGMKIALVFAIGDKAYKAATREFTGIPVLYVDRTDSSPAPANSHEVSSQVDPGPFFTRLKALMPELSTLGVIRTPRDKADYINRIESGAKTADLTAELHSVSSTGELANVLGALYRTVDAVWIRPSPIWTGAALAAAYYEANLQKVPVIGFSRDHFEVPQPPAMIVESSPEGLGTAARARASKLLQDSGSKVEPYASPILLGHLASLRATGINLTKKKAALLDELIR